MPSLPPLAKRFDANPILTPQDVAPSMAGLEVVSLLNPGAFRFVGKTWLLLRVAERPLQEDGWLSTPVLDPAAANGIRILKFPKDDPDLELGDPRGFRYRGETFLTTLSHLRLAWSDDGVRFEVAETPTLTGQGELESFGIEDCRVTELDGRFYLSFSAVSPCGVGVGLASTTDWQSFERHGVIIPPHNKDCALFSERIGGRYYALHRPSGAGLGGNDIWIGQSKDLTHWGAHRCLARTRPGMWDSQRIGAGAAPLRTEAGWLEIY
ncbi:MAG: glycosidase, partial [Deinococcota bacterium]|nr:glycosidase [Deinococcota bacterium]